MIDSMFQQGTDAALADQVQRPRITPPASPPFSLFGLGLAAPEGIGSGVAKSIAFGAEMTGAFGQVEGAYSPASSGGMFSTQTDQERKQANTAREKVAREGVDYSNEAGDTFRRRAADILPDPRTTHASQQVVAGLFDYGTRALGYGLTLGPLAPVAFGGDVAMEESDRLKQQGVDLATRTKAGAVAGVLNAAAVAVPLTGATAAVRFVKGAATGEASIVGQAAAEKAILAHAGYDKIADTFDPYDPVALTLGVVPGVLGAVVGHAAPAAVRKPHAGEAPGFGDLQAAADAARVDPDRIGVLKAEQAKPETTPAERVRLQKEIDTLHATASEAVTHAAVQAEPDMVAAARVGQVVDALDATRLTPDTDLAGRDAHLSAVELAHDQMAAGQDVQVAHLLSEADQQAHLLAEFERLSKQQENDHGQALARGIEPAAGAQAGREVVYRTLEGGTRSAGEFAGATRIRGADAQPLEVFRGASRTLTADDFHPDALGFATKNPSSGLGVFFTPDRAEAARYGNVESAHLDIRNPKVIRADEMPGFDSVQAATAFREKLRAQGHDGIIMSAEHLGGGRNVIAFDPHQVARRSERPSGAKKASSPVRIEDTRDGGLHLFAIDDPSGLQVGSGLAHETSAAVRIRNIGIDVNEARGKGLGVDAYEHWAAYALSRGKELVSDNQVSVDAQRIYAALERRGYTVVRNPKAILEDDGSLSSRGWGVFKVTGAPESRMDRLTEMAAAVDQFRAARTPPEATASRAAREKAPVQETTAQDPAAPQETRSAGADTQPATAIDRAAADVASIDPDMLVHLEGMDAPMRVADLLEKVKEDARQDTLMGKLVEVAAACDLRA